MEQKKLTSKQMAAIKELKESISDVDNYQLKLFNIPSAQEPTNNYRLNHAGYKICEFQNIYMVHTLGHVQKTILPRPCKHSGVRLYYIFRNMSYIKKVFPQEFKAEHYKKYMFFAVLQKCLELKLKDLRYIIQGIKDCKKNRFGKYHS